MTYRFVTSERDWNAVLVARIAMCNTGQAMSPNEQCAASLAHAER